MIIKRFKLKLDFRRYTAQTEHGFVVICASGIRDLFYIDSRKEYLLCVSDKYKKGIENYAYKVTYRGSEGVCIEYSSGQNKYTLIYYSLDQVIYKYGLSYKSFYVWLEEI